MKRTFTTAVFSFTIILYCVFAQNNPKLNDEFLTAVEAGNESKVEHLIGEGVNVNITGENELTALHLAASKGYEKIANLLIKNGADVNAKADLDFTPLHRAVEKAHNNVIDILIRNGANINAKDVSNDTPLHFAAWKGHEKAAELLIRNGANTNVINMHKNTPLLWATQNGYEKIAEMLIMNGADVKAKDRRENTPLHWAAWNGQEKLAELLINIGADVNAVTFYKDSPLHRATYNDHLEVVELLAQKNAIIMVKNGEGKTPIDLAISKGCTKIAEILRENRVANKACGIYESKVLKNRSSDGIVTRILHGEDALPGEFPWMAALGFLNHEYKTSFDCGGTVISDEFILTAAHCVARRVPVVVRLGTLFLTDDSATETLNRQYKEIIKHPNYSSFGKKNDIALIRLSERIVFTEFIKPACLQTDLRDENPDVTLVVTGWGVTSVEKKQKSEVLLKTDLKTMALAECNATLINYNLNATGPLRIAPNLLALRNGIDQSQYCAYDPKFEKDSCQGDSGGPLQLTSTNSHLAKVIGVISFGIGCGAPLPSVYTRIAHYIDWIEPYVWPNEEIAIPSVSLTTT